MKLKKSAFHIQNIPAAPLQFEKRNGYTSECRRYGFHKDGSKWIASDLASGMRIYTAHTRKACVEFCETYKGKIVAAKGSARYHEAVRNMERFKSMG